MSRGHEQGSWSADVRATPCGVPSSLASTNRARNSPIAEGDNARRGAPTFQAWKVDRKEARAASVDQIGVNA